MYFLLFSSDLTHTHLLCDSFSISFREFKHENHWAVKGNGLSGTKLQSLLILGGMNCTKSSSRLKCHLYPSRAAGRLYSANLQSPPEDQCSCSQQPALQARLCLDFYSPFVFKLSPGCIHACQSSHSLFRTCKDRVFCANLFYLEQRLGLKGWEMRNRDAVERRIPSMLVRDSGIQDIFWDIFSAPANWNTLFHANRFMLICPTATWAQDLIINAIISYAMY